MSVVRHIGSLPLWALLWGLGALAGCGGAQPEPAVAAPPSAVTATAAAAGNREAASPVVQAERFAAAVDCSKDASATDPTSAPALVAEPEAASVETGGEAMFEVVATGGGPLQFQWYRNGQPIAGATMARYITPAATAADDGSEYSVTVRNARGEVSSDAATLSVAGAMESGVPAEEPDEASPTGGVDAADETSSPVEEPSAAPSTGDGQA